MLKKIKNEKKKLTVNTGQVMFSGEIYYYWPLIQLKYHWLNMVFLCIIYCVTNAVAIMYSRNIPMAEKRIVSFKSKNVKICSFFYISNNYYIYFKRYFEIFVTNDFFKVYSRGQMLYDLSCLCLWKCLLNVWLHIACSALQHGVTMFLQHGNVFTIYHLIINE